MFAEEEGKILAAKEAEVRCEEFAESGERVLQPSGGRGEFLGPSVGRGEKQKTSRANKPRQNISKQFFRVLHPVEKIGGKNKIKRAQVRQTQCIPGPKTNAFSRLFGGGYGLGTSGQVAFLL